MFFSEDTLEGQLLIDRDDFIEGGKEPHRKAMGSLYAKYRCVKAVDLSSVGQEGTLFAGRRVVQHRDYRVTVSMGGVRQGQLSNTKEVSEGMLTNIKGVNGCLCWLKSIGRPDVAATHSIIPSGVRPKVSLVDPGGQRGSKTMSRGSDNHHDLATPFC